MRAINRMTGVACQTISDLLESAGKVASDLQAKAFANLGCKDSEYDEICSFCYRKAKNVSDDKQGEFGYGDVRT